MASGEYISFLQQRGKKLYRSARYTEALDAFTQAIAKCVTAKASLLDNRAATYEKLGELQSALRDAQTTIRCHTYDATGYLRAGRVLQKMYKPEQAIDIYRYGLAKISASIHDDYQILASVHDRLSRQLSPPKSKDPFTVFPTEVAEMILQLLRFEQIVRCLRVSKAWNRLLISKPWLWSHLDLSKAKRLVPISFVSHAIQRSNGKLDHFTLHRLGDRDERAMELVTRTCRNLRTLELLSSNSMGSSSASLMSLNSLAIKNLVIGKGAEITLDTVTEIMRTCISLSRAEFENIVVRGWSAIWRCNLPNLKQLKLAGNINHIHSAHALNLEMLLPHVPNLEALTLNKWDGSIGISFITLTKLMALDLFDFHAVYMYNGLPPSIKKLRANPGGRSTVFSHPNANLSTLPNLAELEWNAHVNGLRFFQYIAGSGAESSLEKLVVNDSGLSSQEVSTLLNNPRLGHELRELSLSHSNFDDDNAVLVAERFPFLRRLDVSRTKITGVGVKTLVHGRPSALEYLALNQCMDLSPDAVDWAAKQGVQVDFRSQDKLVSGKKVRLEY